MMDLLHTSVSEPVVVLRSKTKHKPNRLLYLVGFNNEFIDNIPLEFNGNFYEIIRRLQPHQISVKSLIEMKSSNNSELAIICDYKILKKNQFNFLGNVRSEKTLRKVPIVIIDQTKENIEATPILEKGVDDFYKLPIQWDQVLERINFLLEHKSSIINAGNPPPEAYKIPYGKRVFDVVVASSALFFLSPFLLIIAVLIKLESKGPILYRSQRAGTSYKVFNFLKFRSMCVDADQKLEALSHLNQYENDTEPAFVKLHNDPRVTRIGKFIRKTSIDELPQLFNVLKGDMSIIGNRPLPLYEAELLTTDGSAPRFIAPAGLTGLWQVSKRGKKDMSAQERIDLDVEYAKKHSFLMDVKIVAKTLPAMIQDEPV